MTKTNWRPTASLENLKKRSQIIAKIRHFFEERRVWEVETLLLGNSTATDPYIQSLSVLDADQKKTGYLQTSPEFPMKRLLAAGSGSIYQMSKAFRAEESGRLHKQEFTILEWYRINFNHHQLMDEMDDFLGVILQMPKAERWTYTELFQHYLNIHPLLDPLETLQTCAEAFLTPPVLEDPHDRDVWLHLLMSHCIEPKLEQSRPVFITDFPVSQAALAKIRSADPPVAERFEVYVKGIELANGYHELADAQEQARRFAADNARRAALNLSVIPVDQKLLSALKHGFPACAGVALGVDRLIMLALNASSIDEVCF